MVKSISYFFTRPQGIYLSHLEVSPVKTILQMENGGRELEMDCPKTTGVSVSEPGLELRSLSPNYVILFTSIVKLKLLLGFKLRYLHLQCSYLTTKEVDGQLFTDKMGEFSPFPTTVLSQCDYRLTFPPSPDLALLCRGAADTWKLVG